MNGKYSRLGFVWPGGGAEHDFYKFLEVAGDNTKLYMSCTRVGGDGGNDHDIGPLKQTARLDWLVEAAKRLIPLDVDCVYWPCTSGSFVLGRDYAEQQVKVLTDTVNVPAGSTSLAFIEALNRTGFSRVSVLSTYPEPASRAFESFLGEFGIEVLDLKWLDAATGWDAAIFEPEFIMQHIPRVLHKDAETLLIPDTAMPTLFAVEDFERIAQIPVLTANAVTMWNAMELMQGEFRVDGFGKLLASQLTNS